MNELDPESNANSVPGAAETGERLCWTAWPCTGCDSGSTAISVLFPSLTAGSKLQRDIEEITREQIAFLQSWVAKCPHDRHVEKHLPRLDAGSEHIVYFEEGTSNVIKLTRPMIYGEFYYILHGRMAQRNCTPLLYLVRLRLWQKLFRGAPVPLGITKRGQIVSQQPFIGGIKPTQETVDTFLAEAGLIPERKAFWFWKREYREEGFQICVGDARADNFVETERGLVPIDLRLWFASLDGSNTVGDYVHPSVRD